MTHMESKRPPQTTIYAHHYCSSLRQPHGRKEPKTTAVVFVFLVMKNPKSHRVKRATGYWIEILEHSTLLTATFNSACRIDACSSRNPHILLPPRSTFRRINGKPRFPLIAYSLNSRLYILKQSDGNHFTHVHRFYISLKLYFHLLLSRSFTQTAVSKSLSFPYKSRVTNVQLISQNTVTVDSDLERSKIF